MGYMIRQLAPNARLSDEHALEALARVIPRETVRAVISDLGAAEARCRKLPAHLTLLLTVAMHLFPREALDRVLFKLLKGLRFLWPAPCFRPATKGAICQARYQLGPRPVFTLFHRVCHPLATPKTQGAFRFGLHVMAMDGTVENVPDSDANARYFGRPSNQYGSAAFPQVRAMYLVECGTHAIVDAGFWPCLVSEHHAARRLLRSVQQGMLLMYDAGLHSADLVSRAHNRGAHLLGRLPSGVHLPVHRTLADGSYLAQLSTGKDWQRQRTLRLLVRVIQYTIIDPNRPGYGERHRLLTTLLDPKEAPALELIDAYHERWESELVIDEIDTHQRLVQQPLRSQKPQGVLQELYGLLLAHYAVRAIMVDAAAQLPLDPRRLSFVHAVQLICDALPEFQMVASEQRPALYQRLLADIQQHRLPQRADRLNPRVVKRKRAKYPPKRPSHQLWPQPTMPFIEAIAILI
jgi:hypothetical protein